MVPSSFMISMKTAACCRLACLHNSREASVWPFLSCKRLVAALSGKTWPGRLRSSGFVSGFISALMVASRSFVETPVVVDLASTLTVN